MHNRGRAPVWLWLSLLSLDAPLVALVWQDFLARCYSLPLGLPTRLALGLTVWAIYLADRLMDVRNASSEGETARHKFYRRHRTFARRALGCVLLVDITLAVGWVRFVILERGLFLAAGIVSYLAAFPLGRLGGIAWKKVSAGLLFTAGVFLIAPTSSLIWQSASFCALCLGNLLLVEDWELRETATRGWIWMTALSFVCLPGHPHWFHAVGLSAAGLAALARWGDRIPTETRGVLADAALLSPLLFR